MNSPHSNRVFIPGVPAPQGSKRHVGGGRLVESSKKVKPWRRAVNVVARQAFSQPLTGPVELHLAFRMPRTKAHGKKTAPPMVQRPDLDKLIRSTLDGLTGAVFVDDSQVVAVHASKRRAEAWETTGVEVQATEIEG